jgi:hypothetical protein
MISPRYVGLFLCLAIPACSTAASPMNPPGDAAPDQATKDVAADAIPDAGSDAPVDRASPETGPDTSDDLGIKPPDAPPDTPSATLAASLVAARATWANAKAQCPIYHYDRSFTSFTGWTATTAIEITNNQPSRRDYVSQENRFGTPDAGPTEQWSETGTQIGNHGSGSPALTVEQILSLCDSVVANNPHEYVRLAINAQGVPVECAFRPVNCADDCDMGFWLSNFACAPLGPGDGGAGGDASHD